jgi:UDP-N-acetylmuramate dehydrogenase
MFIQDNVPLGGYSTMRLGGPAAYLTEINELGEIAEAVTWAEAHQLPIMMIGGGSNIVWRDEGFPGLVLVNRLLGISDYELDEQTLYVTAQGGESWDDFVKHTVDKGYSGIEQLSLIPGTVGGAPVQNIGAYGRELSEALVTLEAYDLHEHRLVTLRASECAFGYRTSRFKTTDRGRFLITSLTVQVRKENPIPPYYQALTSYFQEHQITQITPQTMRDAVIAIRQAKLPDPTLVANCGSFFQNPIVPRETFQQLLQSVPELTTWPSKCFWELPDGGYKLAAGALVEIAGYKGVHDEATGMATWDKQALVLVNEHARSTADLLAFRQKIIEGVAAKFGVTLEQEPELLP